MSRTVVDLTASSPQPDSAVPRLTRYPCAYDNKQVTAAIDCTSAEDVRSVLKKLCSVSHESTKNVLKLLGGEIVHFQDRVTHEYSWIAGPSISRKRKAALDLELSLIEMEESEEQDGDDDDEGVEEDDEEATEDEEDSDEVEVPQPRTRLPPRYATCKHCLEPFNVNDNDDNLCAYHPGDKEADYESDVWVDWDEDCHGLIEAQGHEYPEGFLWTCCEETGDAEGCKMGPHKEMKTKAKRRRYG